MATSVIQVSNISPVATSEQMTTLFSFLGTIEQFRVFPPDNSPIPVSSRVCYIKYHDPVSVGVAQHLTNVVFIDRGLIVVPYGEGKIPDESKALALLAPVTSIAGLMPGAGLLPVPTCSPLASISAVDAVGSAMGAVVGSIPFGALGALQGLDPNFAALGINAQHPTIGNVDPSKIEEIRRTVYVGNLNSQTTTADQLLEFFSQVGEVKFVRMAGDETQPTRFAFVEFADQGSVLRALAFNGAMFGDRPLKINHSNNAIVKPPEMTPQAAAKELEEVMKRVREAQSFISAAIEPIPGIEIGIESDVKNRGSQSQSQAKRSRSRSKQRRSRSKSPCRSHSRHKETPKSKSPRKKRSRSKDRRRFKSRSRSRERKKERESKVKERYKDVDREYGKKKEKKSRTPQRNYSLSRRSRSPSRERFRKKSRSPSKRKSRTPKRKFSRSASPRRSKKEKRKDKDKEHSRDRDKITGNSRAQSRDRSRREHSTSKKKKDKEKERKSKLDKTDTKVGSDDLVTKVKRECSNDEGHSSEKDKESTDTNSEGLVKIKENGNHKLIDNTIEQAPKSENIISVRVEEGGEEKSDTVTEDLNSMHKQLDSLSEDCY
ncbi:splicing regulatory glutamine/lysine-rich protein 1 isoform X1 [Callorhinchus milii]|uniref:Splicing regulatory glutamine/lysine-rich protein 1 n=1 Tax=Callorhinchus milii TaxID=7868 RepID=V9KLA1_CALMI|nr:splicing regulatory glutamine/lysine-rich protein 1 isoform X1 [Callorhinchus milii]